MKHALFVTTLLSLAAASPALAQTTDWSGPYIGGAAGYANPDDDGEKLAFDRDLDGAPVRRKNVPLGVPAPGSRP